MRGLTLILLCVACGGDASEAPLSVRSITPAADAVDVALDTPIVLALSAPPPADFAIELASEGEPIPHAMTVDGATVTLVPEAPLWLAASYTVSAAEAEHDSRFTTRDGTWTNLPLGTDAALRAAPLGAGAAPSIAVTADGTVLAGWEGGGAIYDQQFTPAAGWLALPRTLDVVGDPDAVRIAAASATRAVAAYERYITRANIEARTFDGTQWSAPALVAPYQVGTTRFDQYLGGTAATAAGDALVFHRGSFDTDLFDLYVVLRGASGWGAPVLAESLPGSASGSDIVEDGRGGYVVAWIQRSADKASTAVYAATISSTGAIGAPQLVDDGPGTTYSLNLARGGETVWIAWAHQQGSVGLRVVARPLASGALGGAHQIDLAGYAFGGEWARIAASPRGAVLVFTQYGAVRAALNTSGVWSQPADLDPANDDVGRPVAAIDDRGNATVVWTRVPRTGRRTTVFARARAGAWTPAAQLDEGSGNSYAWTAGVDAAGRVTTAWTQNTPAGYAVYGAHLQ